METYYRSVKWLWVAMLGIVTLSIVNRAVGGGASIGTLNALLDKFTLDAESNVPTWFSSMLLLLGALGWAWMAGRGKRMGSPDAWRFGLLAAVFVYLSCDETSVLHEIAQGPVSGRVEATGFLTHAWTLAAMVPVLVLGVMMLPMLARLSKPLRYGVLAAGFLYVGGAIGVEIIGGAIKDSLGKPAFAYFVSVTIEESMEMAGVIVLIGSLARELYMTAEVAPGGSVAPSYADTRQAA